jgi:hypothetical protein
LHSNCRMPVINDGARGEGDRLQAWIETLEDAAYGRDEELAALRIRVAHLEGLVQALQALVEKLRAALNLQA